jgi:hypothetical protein
VLLRNHWSWVPELSQFAPNEMTFDEDGTGKSKRFSFTWTITSPTTVLLVTGGLKFDLIFNKELTGFRTVQERNANNHVSGSRVVPGLPLQPAPPDFVPSVAVAPGSTASPVAGVGSAAGEATTIPGASGIAMPAAPEKTMGKTAISGGQSGKDFAEAQPEGGVLVGLDLWKGEYYRQLVIGGVRAIYKTNKGLVKGKIYGRGEGNPDLSVESKPGVTIKAIEAIDDKQQMIALRAVFSNGEMSAWLGRELANGYSQSRIPKNLEFKRLDPGKPVLGIFGGADGTLYRFGLLY